MFDIVALLACTYICNGTRADSDTAFGSSIGIIAENNRFFLFCCDWILFVCIADDDVIGLIFCYSAIITDYRIRIGAFIDGNALPQYLYVAGIGNVTIKTIQIIVLHLLISRRFHGVPYTHDLRMRRIFCLVGTTDDKCSTACTASNAIHQSFLHICDRIKMLTVCRGIKIAAGAFDTISCTHDDGTIAVCHFIGSTCNHIGHAATHATFHRFIGIERTDNRGKCIFCSITCIQNTGRFILISLYIITANRSSEATTRIGVRAQRGRCYTKLSQLVSRSITNGNFIFRQSMGTDFNGACPGIGVGTYCNAFR